MLPESPRWKRRCCARAASAIASISRAPAPSSRCRPRTSRQMRFAMSLACSFTLYYQFVDTYTRKPPKLVDSLMCKLISGAALVALTMATPTFAADLAVKAAGPVVPVLFSWTGCYAGGHVGAVVSEDRTTSRLGNSENFSSAGFVGGGQAGCDYQFAHS